MRRFLLLVLLAACVTRESFPEQYRAAVCEYHERCGTDWGGSDDGVSCEDSMADAGVGDALAGDSYDDGDAAGCLDWLRDEASCDSAENPHPHPCDSLQE